MAGLPKKYFKMFPGNLKKGWAKFRADRGAGAGTGKKKAKKRTRARAAKRKSAGVPARAHHHHGGKMASKRKRSGRVHRVARRVKAGMSTKPGQVIMAAGMAAAGGVATSFAVNSIPKVKDMSSTVKSAIQGGAGIAAIMFGRKRWVKSLGSGAVIAAVFGISKDMLKLNPLAGPSAGAPTLTADQLRRLVNGGMGVPASVRMGVPAKVSMAGGRNVGSGWSSGW